MTVSIALPLQLELPVSRTLGAGVIGNERVRPEGKGKWEWDKGQGDQSPHNARCAAPTVHAESCIQSCHLYAPSFPLSLVPCPLSLVPCPLSLVPSINLGPRLLHHFRPLGIIRADDLREVFRRAAYGVGALRGEQLAQLGRGQ